MIPCSHCLAQPTPVLSLVPPPPLDLDNLEAARCHRCGNVTLKALPKKDLRFILQAKLSQTNKPLLRRLWADKRPEFPGYPKGLV